MARDNGTPAWYLYKMVAQNTVRTYLEGIRYFDIINAFVNIEKIVKNYLPSYVRNMF